MRRGLLVLLGVVLLAAGALAASRVLPGRLRALVLGEGSVVEEAAEPLSVDEAREIVRRTLPALGLEASDLVAEHAPESRDARGAWTAWETRWRLGLGEDAEATARRLASLVTASRPDLEAYVVPSGTGATDVRVYAGSRLAALLHLEPTLADWPRLGPSDRPLLALVIDGVDRDPHGTTLLLGVPQPLAVALSPYSPYTLRLARDAVTLHKEVLARVEPDTTPTEALEAVPHATGVLLAGPPRGEPDTEAAALATQDAYVVDAAPDGLPAAWIRALGDAGVPRLRGAVHRKEGSADDLRAFRALAAREGSGVLVADVDGPETRAAVESLPEAATRGFRPSFVAEVVQADSP